MTVRRLAALVSVIVIRTLSLCLAFSSLRDGLESLRTTVLALPALSENRTEPSETLRRLAFAEVTAYLLTVWPVSLPVQLWAERRVNRTFEPPALTDALNVLSLITGLLPVPPPFPGLPPASDSR